MSLVVSALSDYSIEQEHELIVKSHFSGKTAEMIRSGGIVLSGVKSSEKLPLMETDVVFQAGGSCGFSASGTTTLSDRTVTVGKIRVMEALCPKDLEAKATQKKLSLGSTYSDIYFANQYRQEKAAGIAEALETADWQGDTTSGTANLQRYDGLLKLIDAAAASIIATNAKTGTGTITSATGNATVTGSGTAFTTEVAVGDKLYGNVAGTYTLIGTVLTIGSATSITLAANGAVAVTAQAFRIVPAAASHFASPIAAATGITASNVRDIISNVYLSLPARLKNKPDVRIFVGWDTFEIYTKALLDANNFHFSATQADGEITIPGTQYKVVAVHGLNDTDRVIAVRLSNLAMAVDMENEEEKFRLFFATEADQVRFDVEFKRGVNVVRPADVVSFKLV
jgi:nucleoid DNA-binding protein